LALSIISHNRITVSVKLLAPFHVDRLRIILNQILDRPKETGGYKTRYAFVVFGSTVNVK
jgi:hypothetical protein